METGQAISKDLWWTANQTLYFPAMYMMQRFAQVSTVVLMTEAQFSKFGHQSRALIGTKQGHLQLTLPLRDKSFKRLCDIEIADPAAWYEKLSKTLQSTYGRCDGYKEYGRKLLESLDVFLKGMAGGHYLMSQAAICSFLTQWCIHIVQLKCETVYSTELVEKRPEDANDWLIELGRKAGGLVYLGGAAARDAYVDMEKWNAAGMHYVAQEWQMPEYKALWGIEKDGNIAMIDCLFVHGVEKVREVLGVQDAVQEA